KQAVVDSKEGDTILTMKDLTPVRLIRNPFFQQVKEAEMRCASKEELVQLLGKARAKRGMFEGDLEEGELEIGQVSAILKDIPAASYIVKNIKKEFLEILSNPLK